VLVHLFEIGLDYNVLVQSPIGLVDYLDSVKVIQFVHVYEHFKERAGAFGINDVSTWQIPAVHH
jgi:hypothetical protein